MSTIKKPGDKCWKGHEDIETLSIVKKNEIMQFAATQMDPEIMLHGSFLTRCFAAFWPGWRRQSLWQKWKIQNWVMQSLSPEALSPFRDVTGSPNKGPPASRRPSHPLLSSGPSRDTKEPGLTLRSQRFQNLTVQLMG